MKIDIIKDIDTAEIRPAILEDVRMFISGTYEANRVLKKNPPCIVYLYIQSSHGPVVHLKREDILVAHLDQTGSMTVFERKAWTVFDFPWRSDVNYQKMESYFNRNPDSHCVFVAHVIDIRY